MRAAAERHPGEAMPPAACLGRKTHRIERLGIGPMFRHVMGVGRIDADEGARGNIVAAERKVLERSPGNRRHRRHQPQCFLERIFREHQLIELAVRHLVLVEAERRDLLAQPLLPILMPRQQHDQAGRRRRDRIVRRHHQEIHVIGDRRGAERLAVVPHRAAEDREEILARAGPPRRNLALEQIDQIGARLHALAHRRAGQRRSDRGDRCLHLIDERLVDPVGLRAQRHAEETRRGEIEAQRLHRVVKAQLLARPLADARGDSRVQLLGVMPHRLRLEGDRHHLAIGAVVLEIHQHQPAREQQVEHRAPALFGREHLVAIEQHQLVRVGAEHDDRWPAERVVAIDRAVGRHHPLRESERILEHLEGVAEERQPVFAGNPRDRSRRVERQPMRVGFDRVGVGHGGWLLTYTSISKCGVRLNRR